MLIARVVLCYITSFCCIQSFHQLKCINLRRTLQKGKIRNMSEQHPTSKFPYLILGNLSAEKVNGDSSQRNTEHQNKRIVNQSNGRNGKKGELDINFPNTPANYLSEVPDETVYLAPGTTRFGKRDGQNGIQNRYASINVSQVKAILTAQTELRKPAASLYPSSSQFSLIPETEIIYKKYFPTDENEVNNVISTRNKELKKIPSLASNPHPTATTAKTAPAVKSPPIPKESKFTLPLPTVSVVAASASESSIRNVVNNTSKDFQHSVLESAVLNPSARSVKDVDAKFKKRVHQQLISLSSEVERQSTELSEMKKEFKELRQVVRKHAVDYENSKSISGSLSKSVQEMDSKLDSLQETVNSQEKSILSKLMLLGGMSDSDSDFDDSDMKGLDALTSPSSTKLRSTSPSKRSFGNASTLTDSFPKACSNWIPIAPDFDKLLQSVALLNYRMDRNQSMKLCTTSSGAVFKHADVVDLTLFKNGMVVGCAGFRSYSTMSVIRFVNEIFNGFLPTELSSQYPDGVVIVLNDKRSIVHSIDVGFSGSGSKLSTVNNPPSLVPGTDINNVLSRKPSAESLPASSKTSNISLPLLSSVSSATQIGGSYENLPDLASDSVDKNRQTKLIVLKINDRKNGRKFKLKVPTTATVECITDHIRKFLMEQTEGISTRNNNNNITTPESKSLDIILPVPYGKLSSTESTLEEYGIIHNTLVYIQERDS